MSVKMNTRNMSNEELETLFTESFEQTVAIPNEIGEFEALCERETASDKVTFMVDIVGFAGTPTSNDYREGKLTNSGSLVISRADKGSLRFNLKPEKTVMLGGIDYQVIYESE